MEKMLAEIHESIYNLAQEVYRTKGISNKARKDIVDSLHFQTGGSFSNLLTSQKFLKNLSMLFMYKEIDAAIDYLNHDLDNVREKIKGKDSFYSFDENASSLQFCNDGAFALQVKIVNYISGEPFYLYLDFKVNEVTDEMVEIAMDIYHKEVWKAMNLSKGFFSFIVQESIYYLNKNLHKVFNKPAKIYSGSKSVFMPFKPSVDLTVGYTFCDNLLKEIEEKE